MAFKSRCTPWLIPPTLSAPFRSAIIVFVFAPSPDEGRIRIKKHVEEWLLRLTSKSQIARRAQVSKIQDGIWAFSKARRFEIFPVRCVVGTSVHEVPRPKCDVEELRARPVQQDSGG